MLSHVWLFVTPWTTAHQAPLSMWFSRQGYWSGLPFPTPGNLPSPGIEPASPVLAGGFFTTVLLWKPQKIVYSVFKWNLLEMGVKSFTIKIWRQISHISLRSNNYRRPLFSSHYLENQYGTVSSLFLTLAHSGKNIFHLPKNIFWQNYFLSYNDLIKINFANYVTVKLILPLQFRWLLRLYKEGWALKNWCF